MFVRMLRSLIWLGSPTAQIYKGLLIKANPDPHPELAHRLQGLLPAGSRVLDFGAGQGALSMRLKDLGYEVVAVDQDADSFLAKEVPFFHLDFNDSPQVSQCVSQHEGQFDAVIGMEVIEHVENPWEYLRLLKRMAKSGGLIVVTTPNVESWASRWNYLLTGRLTHFEDGDYIGSGHINPISSWEFRLSAEALGLVNIRTYETCRLPLIWITRNLRLMIGSFILAPIRFALTGRISGDITLCVARKPADGAPF